MDCAAATKKEYVRGTHDEGEGGSVKSTSPLAPAFVKSVPLCNAVKADEAVEFTTPAKDAPDAPVAPCAPVFETTNVTELPDTVKLIVLLMTENALMAQP